MKDFQFNDFVSRYQSIFSRSDTFEHFTAHTLAFSQRYEFFGITDVNRVLLIKANQYIQNIQ